MKNPSWGKLEPNWERPYRVTSVARLGAYRLEDLNEISISQPWSVNNFWKYYYQCKSLCMIMFIYTAEMYQHNFFFYHFYYADQNVDQEFEVILLRVKQNLGQI